MTTILPNIDRPELFFGFVGAVGANLQPTIDAFGSYFASAGYRVVSIKVTDAFPILEKTIKLPENLNFETEHKRIVSHIKYGNALRAHFHDHAIMATIAIENIVQKRNLPKNPLPGDLFQRTVYLIRQFKRKEEIELLRSVYERLFFQVSVYSRRNARVNALSLKFAEGENSANSKKYRASAEELVQIDEDEIGTDHGQQVAKIFHDADLIVNTDSNSPDVKTQVHRFSELIFSSNKISPTKHEYGMFLAKAAALRTLDLSRQVGAAIFTEGGEIVCLGSNEVPKAGGGTYWSDDEFDDREYRRGYDSNDKRKNELLREVIEITKIIDTNQGAILRKNLKNPSLWMPSNTVVLCTLKCQQSPTPQEMDAL
jgi:deoxycytidylate deaminase